MIYGMCFMNMSIMRVIKRIFVGKGVGVSSRALAMRVVSDGEIVGRLSRGMPIEHITCDEYVPLPGGKYYFNYRPAAAALQRDNKEVKEAYKEAYNKKYDEVHNVKEAYNKTDDKTDDNNNEFHNVEEYSNTTGSYEVSVDSDSNKSGYYNKTDNNNEAYIRTGSISGEEANSISKEDNNYNKAYNIKNDLLKESITDAKAMRAVVLINAKVALDDSYKAHGINDNEYRKQSNELNGLIEVACEKEYGSKFTENRKMMLEGIDGAIRKRRVRVYEGER